MERPFTLDFDHLGALAVVYGVNCLGAVLIALVGWWIASIAERMALRGLLSTSHMDRTVAAFLSSLVRYALLAVTLVLILQIVGIQATSLVAVIGASSLAIGLALQGTLSNMAAGVMLLLFRPFKLGDSIEVGGKSGTVQNLNLFFTELAGGDNVQVLIPNGQVWGQAMINHSAYGIRRVGLKLPVPSPRTRTRSPSGSRAFSKRMHGCRRAPWRSRTSPTSVELSAEAWTTSGETGNLRIDLMQQALGIVTEPDRKPVPQPASA
ncbi:mechanosensitive ion channel family protein [Dongia sedimenti]|uniref:Small-conductance mechanosensitive channel n=1 Tax=Dongia sedimenti TaxID=3064282 RepID=A0ABU0YFX1_9PROT|nr:mechanosensitive ion channel [Rhodospirillaceae bacterium R-7]